jgi:hypothetical protein
MEIPKVKRVFKIEPDKDGFSVELENGEIIEISKTEWNSDFKTTHNDQIFFSTRKGYDISFSEEQVTQVESL